MLSSGSVKPAAAVPDLIAANAKHLLSDALSLRAKRRYSSAAALAVLSLEEAGKLALLEGLFDIADTGDYRRLRNHKLKLVAATHAVIYSMANYDMESIINSQSYKSEWVRNGSSKSRSDETSLAKIFAQVNVEAFERQSATKLRDRRQYRFILMLAKGQFDDVKRQALYVDVSATGNVLSTPAGITRDAADRIIRVAKRAISTIAITRKRNAKIAARVSDPNRPP